MEAPRPTTEDTLNFRARGFVTCQLVGLLAMMAVTWKLWFPPWVSANEDDAVLFPAIPVFGLLGKVSPFWSCLSALLVVVFACVAIYTLWRSKKQFVSTALLAIVAFVLIGSIQLNQHRFFPWAWQTLLFCAAWPFLPAKSFVRFGRVLFVSIYIYSAIAKLDYQFVKTTGRQILHTLTSFVQIDSTRWTELSTDFVVLAIPLMELLIGLGLLWGATRLVAMFFAIGMHSTLILVLGPLGLDNAESVLLWNVQFIVQVLFLYWPAKRTITENTSPGELAESGFGAKRFWVAAIVVTCLPALEKLNCIDHWPAWGLYSPQASRCRLKVADWKVKQLPEELQIHFRPIDDPLTSMREFDLAGWSFEQLNSPLYPQDRFQLGVAWYLVERLGVERAFSIEIQSASHFWTGKRNVKVVTDIKALENLRNKFWVNYRPAGF